MDDKTVDNMVIEYKGYKDIAVTVKDMPNRLFEDIAVLCGVDVAVKLLKAFGGNTIVVPLNGFEKIEKKIILREYDNDYITIKRLSRNLEMAEKTVRNVLEGYRLIPAEEGQMNLFTKDEWKQIKHKPFAPTPEG